MESLTRVFDLELQYGVIRKPARQPGDFVMCMLKALGLAENRLSGITNCTVFLILTALNACFETTRVQHVVIRVECMDINHLSSEENPALCLK